ncbi:MAG: DUF998 domain-containing protein [Flavobacterium sp. JAD_PAG50586_2]|nr:MAG: DUF998 domain-containing protein [Flavobacterium sp. JAD_PAG50586_2]
MSLLAILSLICGAVSLLLLLSLHFVSPEFKPSWKMVSEYALGKNKTLLTFFFFCWGFGSLLNAIVLWNIVTNSSAAFGVVLVFISGVGAIMGGLFDVKHKWHGLAFLLGIPTLLIGSLLVAYNLITIESWQIFSTLILVSTHLVWISCGLMATTMMVMIAGFKSAGVPFGKDAKPPKQVPDGVIALVGYANRLLVCCYIFWTMLTAYIFLSI